MFLVNDSQNYMFKDDGSVWKLHSNSHITLLMETWKWNNKLQIVDIWPSSPIGSIHYSLEWPLQSFSMRKKITQAYKKSIMDLICS